MANFPVYTAADGTTYQDGKRKLWVYGGLIGLVVALSAPTAYMLTHSTWVLWLYPVFLYVAIPLTDIYMGEDENNPPEAIVPKLEAAGFYMSIARQMVYGQWALFIFYAWFVAAYVLPWYGMLPIAISMGMFGGGALNVGHELGHKKDAKSKWHAKVMLSMIGYGHFTIEHNKGHHKHVATPEDPASSKMGETIYHFVLREIPGGFKRAWLLETERLNRRGQSAWSLDNEILQPMLITVAAWSLIIVWLGTGILPFMLISSALGWFQLTSANYIEHYGLLREKLDNGRYEQCRPCHSWNSNHKFSNYLTLHLQRHSDHHANPTRSYQSLRHFDEAPQLPNGYFGMFLLAYIPALWFSVMDHRLVELVDGNLDKINMLPAKREKLVKSFNLKSYTSDSHGHNHTMPA